MLPADKSNLSNSAKKLVVGKILAAVCRYLKISYTRFIVLVHRTVVNKDSIFPQWLVKIVRINIVTSKLLVVFFSPKNKICDARTFTFIPGRRNSNKYTYI